MTTYDFTQTIRIEETEPIPAESSRSPATSIRGPMASDSGAVTKPAESTLKVTHYSFEDVRTIINAADFFPHLRPNRELRFSLRRASRSWTS